MNNNDLLYLMALAVAAFIALEVVKSLIDVVVAIWKRRNK